VARPEPDEIGSAGRSTRLTGSSAVRLHLTLALGLAICVGAFCIEVMRALEGNSLSWVYVIEWPILAAFALYMWWNLLNGRAGNGPRRPAPTRPGAVDDDEDDYEEKLGAWNRYLKDMEDEEAARRDLGP